MMGKSAELHYTKNNLSGKTRTFWEFRYIQKSWNIDLMLIVKHAELCPFLHSMVHNFIVSTKK